MRYLKKIALGVSAGFAMGKGGVVTPKQRIEEVKKLLLSGTLSEKRAEMFRRMLAEDEKLLADEEDPEKDPKIQKWIREGRLIP